MNIYRGIFYLSKNYTMQIIKHCADPGCFNQPPSPTPQHTQQNSTLIHYPNDNKEEDRITFTTVLMNDFFVIISMLSSLRHGCFISRSSLCLNYSRVPSTINPDILKIILYHIIIHWTSIFQLISLLMFINMTTNLLPKKYHNTTYLTKFI